jgi:hypothetical protein
MRIGQAQGSGPDGHPRPQPVYPAQIHPQRVGLSLASGGGVDGQYEILLTFQ